MSQQAARHHDRSEARPLALASAEELLEMKQELQSRIARRAYELFEGRSGQHGHETDDWLQAESELLSSCRHEIREHQESFVLRAETPGPFTAAQIKVSVEPHRVMVSARRQTSAIYATDNGSETRPLLQRFFRVHDLPVAVDPSRSTATLGSEKLEIVMPKLVMNRERAKTAARMSSGR